jgi:hypothetical protein
MKTTPARIVSLLFLFAAAFLLSQCGRPAHTVAPEEVSKGLTNDDNPDGKDVNTGDNNSANPNSQDQDSGYAIGVPIEISGGIFTDIDGDGIRNEEDPDIDGDGILNHLDTDIDGDNIENVNDPDMDGDGILNINDNDIDGDGILNINDNDMDGDGILNINDNDIDGDGILNINDSDIDGDGIPNLKDRDGDGDGIINVNDNDMDGDGIPNESDPDMDGDGIPNTQDPDMDGDGILNEDDTDLDGDGVVNTEDPDVDGDGIPNESDPDDDNDGIPDGDDDTPQGNTGGDTDGGPAGQVTYVENFVLQVTAGDTLFTVTEEVDFDSIRADIEEDSINLQTAEITNIIVRADSSAYGFLDKYPDLEYELRVSYKINSSDPYLQILHTPPFDNASSGGFPTETMGNLKQGVVLNESLFTDNPDWAIFSQLFKDETVPGATLIFVFLLKDPVAAGDDADLDMELEVEATSTKKL